MLNNILVNPEKELIARRLSKKFILALSLGLFCLWLPGNAPLASKQQIAMFKNSKTCVVFEDGISFYNAFIKDAVQKYWKSTDYGFIDHKEFEKRRTDSKYSFIVLMNGAYDKDPGGVSYSYINLVLGDALGMFHSHVGPPQDAGAGKCFEMIFDPEGNLYYYNFRKITNQNADGFNLNDFKKIK